MCLGAGPNPSIPRGYGKVRFSSGIDDLWVSDMGGAELGSVQVLTHTEGAAVTLMALSAFISSTHLTCQTPSQGTKESIIINDVSHHRACCFIRNGHNFALESDTGKDQGT